MSTTDIPLMTMTVNETVRRYPATIAVFNRYGIDTCCGGGMEIAEAAAQENVDTDALRSDLRRALGDTA